MNLAITIFTALMISACTAETNTPAATDSDLPELVGAWAHAPSGGLDAMHRFEQDGTAILSRGVQDRPRLNWRVDVPGSGMLTLFRVSEDGKEILAGYALFALDGDNLSIVYRKGETAPEDMSRAITLVRVDEATAEKIERDRLTRRARLRAIQSF